MPCVYIDTSHIKDILAALPPLPPCNWLITGLDCLDYCGWEGCEKWAESELFLTDAELRRDVNLRDMQIVWGVFSAIPAEHTREEIFSYPPPETETPRYMRDHIEPQHPLAVLELYADDASFVLASARDETLLRPLYALPFETHDEEADNRVVNAQLRRIQETLRREVPDASPVAVNEVQWNIWRGLFRSGGEVNDELLRLTVLREYDRQLRTGERKHGAIWDPYTQE